MRGTWKMPSSSNSSLKILTNKLLALKRIILIILVSLSSLYIYGQNDKFSTYAEMVGKEVTFYDAAQQIKALGKFLFVKNEKGKLVAVKDVTPFQSIQNGECFHVNQIVTIKNKQYLECSSANETIYFLVSEKYPILPNFRSATVWEEALHSLREECPYLKLQDKQKYAQNDIVLGKFVKVAWNKFEFPKTIGSDVFFSYNHGRYTSRIPYASIRRSDFASEADVQEEKNRQDEEERRRVEQERRDSIDDYIPIIARSKYHDSDWNEMIDSLGMDNHHVYAIIDNKAHVFHWEEKVVSLDSLVFDDEGRYLFLLRRGNKGLAIRKKIAFQQDSIMQLRVAHCIDSLRNLSRIAENNFYNELNRRQIFILKDLYSYSDYKFGKKFTFYNCFNKRIKYINITLTAYNGVGDIQRDDIGRSSAKLRGIGPIEKGDIASYDWDEIFWDDNDIINKVLITNISFTFFDGTTKSYSGKANIDKHRAANCYEDDDD